MKWEKFIFVTRCGCIGKVMNKKGKISTMKKLLLSVLLTSIHLLIFAQNYRVAVQPTGSKFWGYANEKGELVIGAKFLKYTDFSQDGFAAVQDDKKRFYFIDINGNELVLPVSNYEIPNTLGFNFKGFSEGAAIVTVNKKAGVINSKGKWIHEPAFTKITPFNEGIAVAQNGLKHIILGINGESYSCAEEVIDIKDFTEGLAPFKGKNQLFGFVNSTGDIVVPAKFLSVGYFSGGLAWAKTSNQTIGFIDKNGNWVIQPKFEAAKEFDATTGVAMVKEGTEWKLIDKTGKTIIVNGATGFGEFNEGLGYAKKGTLVGFINSKGEWVIEAAYDKVERMFNGYSNVKKGDFWGVIDKTGKVIIPTTYQGVNPNHDGLFAVKKDLLWGFMDKSGKVVVEFNYTGIRDFDNGFAAVKLGDSWGMIDKSGNQILKHQYDRVQDMIKIP